MQPNMGLSWLVCICLLLSSSFWIVYDSGLDSVLDRIPASIDRKLILWIGYSEFECFCTRCGGSCTSSWAPKRQPG